MRGGLSVILLCIIFFPYICHGIRVLVFPAHMAASHAKSMHPMISNLAKHGHHVVMFQIVKYEDHLAKAPVNSSIHDRYINVPMRPGEADFLKELPADMIWAKPTIRLFTLLPWKLTSQLCKDVLENKKLKEEFDQVIKEGWDLVIVDEVFAPCGRLAAKEARRWSNATVINFGTSVLLPPSLEIRGLPLQKAAYPSGAGPLAGSYEHQNFLARAWNIFDHTVADIRQIWLQFNEPSWLGLPRNEYTVGNWFTATSDMLMSSISPMLDFTKPISNDIIDLDTNCPSHGQLPESYAKFVNDPKSKGTIVFAMGHFVNWNGAPANVLQSFLIAFTRLADYRIIWQYTTHSQHKPIAPDHILFDKWIPQSALLYHPKTVLFISHAGMKSMREAICSGVPMVAMPMFAEQLRNTAAAQKKGIARYLDKANLSPTVVYDTIQEVLNDPSFTERVHNLRDQLADRIVRPMELGRFWSEFLTRRGSDRFGKYFKLAVSNRDHPWYQTGPMNLVIVGAIMFLASVSVLC